RRSGARAAWAAAPEAARQPCCAAGGRRRRCCYGGRRAATARRDTARRGPGTSRPLRFLVLHRLRRYEESTNELINEELGIAYPVVDGIPTMIPEAARKTRAEPKARPVAEGMEQP
uniref:Uncharacterized protein n=1 Tax=Dromaius novaehollandiae TaxID=8790 RepID=A0A8C4JBG1_DRONO